MELLKKLKEVRKTKQDYFVLQHRFYAELSKKFPHLMNSDMAKVANELEKELHILLCTALRYKSIKIQLTAVQRFYSSNVNTSYVNIQRSEPGFYYPQSQRGRSDIDYMNLKQYIVDNDDMYKMRDKDDEDDKNEPKDYLFLALSELKTQGKRIIPEKLDIYFKFLREIMIYRPKFLCYTSAGYDTDVKRMFNIKGLSFNLQPKSMEVAINGSERDRQSRYSDHSAFEYEKEESDILHMLDYNEIHGTSFDADVHKRLKLFINYYKEIYAKFELEEVIKRKAYKTCSEFLKQIKAYTLPFKILGIITKQ